MSAQPEAKESGRYPKPSVTVDVVVFAIFGTLSLDEDPNTAPNCTPGGLELRVLLVCRRNAPFKGHWAIPGGFVGIDESLDEAARRELEEETGLRDVYMEQLYTFGDPGRDPRTRVISVAYYALLPGPNHTAQGGDDAAEAAWHSVNALPENLAFDHQHILDVALRRLRAKADYAGIAREFLPPTFTLRQLRCIYETVLGRSLDRANFTRRVLTEGDIEETGHVDRSGAHRPAKVYRYRRDRGQGARDKE
jgi:8-oxo-dGTP diphosphatase